VAILLFDLDGTLIDSIQLILESAEYAFAERAAARLRAPTRTEWLGGVGRPLSIMFRTFIEAHEPAPDEQVERLTQRYREYQMANHDRLVRAYPGVAESLEALTRAGHTLGVVTSKTTSIAIKGMRHVGIEHFFSVVIGCDVCDRHKPDPEPIRFALRELGADPLSLGAVRPDGRSAAAAYIGDSVHDMQAGRAAAVVTVGALWGPFSRADLEPAEPTFWAARPADVTALFG
jgi:pyrophosphatase PpaX